MLDAQAIFSEVHAELVDRVLAGQITSEQNYHMRVDLLKQRGLVHVVSSRYIEARAWLREKTPEAWVFMGDDYFFQDENLAFEFKMLFG